MTRMGCLVLTSVTWLIGLSPVAAQGTSDGIAFFEARIRPALIKYCYECHSAQASKVRGGLLLDSRAGWQRGGNSGPVIIPGKPEASLLVQAVRYDRLKMPPKEKLPDQVIADLTHWVKIGAPDPRGEAADAPQAPIAPAPKELWSLRPITRPVIPAVKDVAWPRSEIDRFILAQLEQKGLTPAPDAEPYVLLRRLHYVLTGLPPTVQQRERFLQAWQRDPESALEQAIDELLASRHFGERWARHWLDLARYADVSGTTAPTAYPEAWRYREYVIHAFNSDKPFDEFVRQQLAGDLLPASTPQQRAENLIATGYLALFHIVAADRDAEKRKLDVMDEQIEVLGKTFLGLALGCARCHDHKLDPISMRDYYALAGIFRSTNSVGGGFGSTQPTRVALSPVSAEAPRWMQGDKVTVLAVLEEKNPRDEPIHFRGEVDQVGEIIPRGFPSLVPVKSPPRIPPNQSGRLQLAEWLLHEENPLVPRVVVNRIWQHVFGQGLVRTPDNFGTTGDPPSHPELLDYLAWRFREHHRWSFKSLIKELLRTRVWRQSAQGDAASRARDPDNRWLSRAKRRRLEAEALHDALLFVAGQLDLEPATYTVPTQFKGTGNQSSTINLAIAEEILRKRAIYWPVFRKDVPMALDMLSLFDMPVATSPRGARASSITPAQALFLLNSPLVLTSADALAQQCLRPSDGNDAARLEQLYLRLYSRPPSPAEQQRALAFLAALTERLCQEGVESQQARRTSWMRLCHTLLLANEFLVVD
ncbi:MAG: PSD1 and planctomycete cytochrome C domain-containing protein [Gemmatales bacterium]|nr:PSD1 and planctomycete cytochrome C domain-containing protein [Gemmatales bacterium]MDW8222712.1 PSD1 and planctomycete cytochrome C domain-containing protein [Gemmatales bacterium]